MKWTPFVDGRECGEFVCLIAGALAAVAAMVGYAYFYL